MNYGELFKKKLIQLEFFFSVGQYRIPVDFFYTSEIQGKDGDYHRAFKIIDLKEMFSKDFKIFLDNKNLKCNISRGGREYVFTYIK